VVWAACRQDNLSNSVFSQNPVAPGMSGTGSTGMTQTSATIHDCSGSGCAPVNTTTYFHGDQIGSARLLSAGYGYPVWQGTFTPFGQEVSPEITSNHYKFNGKERGEATEGGLDYFGARYYSSVIGRWMTPDWSDAPSAVPYAKLTNPQSLNLYSFVTDDPLSHTDLDGHFQSAPASGACPNNNGDSCTVSTSTSVTVGGTLFGGGSVVDVKQTTTTTYIDANGNKVEVSQTKETQATYDKEAKFQGASERTITSTSVNGKSNAPDSYNSSDWKKSNVTASEFQKAMGGLAGRVMDMVVQNATPGLYPGAAKAAVQHPWETLERGGAGALMALCFVGEPCGAIEAGLSLAVGAGAAGKEIWGDKH
jgi:RHS repeat-associated protein